MLTPLLPRACFAHQSRANRWPLALTLGVILLWLAVLLPLRQAQAVTPPPSSPVKKLFVASHIDDFLIAMEDKKSLLIRMSRNLPGSQPPVATEEAATTAMFADIFVKEQMSAVAQDYLVQHYDPVVAQGALAFARTPMAARLILLEAEASLPEHREAMRDYLNTMQNHIPSQQRVATLYKLDSLTHSSRWMASILQLIASGLETQVQSKTEYKLINKDRLVELINGLKEQSKSYLESRPGVQFLAYAYRDVPDATLADYAQQLQTKEAAWFMKVTKKALIEAIKPSINLYTARFVEQL